MTGSNQSWMNATLPILGCFGGGSLYGWSGLSPTVQIAFNVGSGLASMVFSFALASFTIGVLLSPMLLGRIPSRYRLSFATALAAASLAASCVAPSFDIFVVTYGIGFGFSSGVIYSLAIAHASASRRPNLFVPISVAAFGLGGAVFGPMGIWLAALGWSVWSTLPALCCLAFVATANLLTTQKPTEYSLVADNKHIFVNPDRTILKLWMVFAAGSCAGLIVLGLASNFLVTNPASQAAAIFAAAAGNTVGRLSASAVASWCGPKPGILGALSASILSLTALGFTTAPVMIVAWLFLIAFSYGQVASQTPLLVSRHFSGSAFPSAFGWVFTGWGVAGLLGPWGAGWVLEMTGDLRFALLGCILICLLGLWLTIRLPEPKAKIAEG